MLDDNAPELQSYALRKLNGKSGYKDVGNRSMLVVESFWHEIDDHLPRLETLYEDTGFSDRKLAALVASKVHFYLSSYDLAMTYALGAEELFDLTEKSSYTQKIIDTCIDTYVTQRVSGGKIDTRMEGIVDRMFEKCFVDKQFKQAIGIAIEARRMDMFVKSIEKAENREEMLSYAFRVVMNFQQSRSFRGELLRNLIQLYKKSTKPDYVQMVQNLIFLDDPEEVASILESLSQGSTEDVLMAYQIAFDLYESATQQFVNKVLNAVRKTAPIPSAVMKQKEAVKETATETKAEGEEKMETDEPAAAETAVVAPASEDIKEKKLDDLSAEEKAQQNTIEKLTTILSGEKSIYCHLQFLIRNDKTDMLILKQTKDAVRVSVCHYATVVANGFMHCGTTHDSFLRDNLDWLARATNWDKLSATASLGVIHRGHEKDSLALMQTYLPKDSANSSGFAEGGGLYALGLIHANHGGDITEYLLGQLKQGGNEPIVTGGCLGLGLAAMGTHRADVYEQLKFTLYQDHADTGESAGIAMGLVMLGSKSAEAIEDMVGYAQETQHEKIQRGLAIGIALVMYGRLEEADTLIDTLCRDKDANLRRSGMYTIAMAYCGTASNAAIQRLLHMAASDVDADVRRTAVMALGFLLFKKPEQCPELIALVYESYIPRVRYGAAMALGIACAGTGSREAMAIIEPMTNDNVSYVRRAALIASAMIMIQHTEVTCPKVKEFRAMYAKIIADKHEDVMVKLGAIFAQGIIDAGGRNVTVSLQSRTGHTNMMAVVGMLIFTQYWYWFPLAHFLSLAFTPSCVIGLNENLDMPVMGMKSNAKPSTYGYPPPLEEKKKEDKEKVATAVLSITAKQKKKEAEKKKDTKDTKEEKMEVDEKKEEKKEKEKEDKKDEPNFEILQNPCRVVRPQLNLISLEEPTKHKPVKDLSIGGIIMVKRIDGSEENEAIVEPVTIAKAVVDSEDEPEPPEPFEYTE